MCFEGVTDRLEGGDTNHYKLRMLQQPLGEVGGTAHYALRSVFKIRGGDGGGGGGRWARNTINRIRFQQKGGRGSTKHKTMQITQALRKREVEGGTKLYKTRNLQTPGRGGDAPNGQNILTFC